jgi:hypothetical protein
MSSMNHPLRHPLRALLLGGLLASACSGDHDAAHADGSVAAAADAATPIDAPAPLPDAPAADASVPPPPTGRWTTGDLHVHTFQSNDAQTPQSLLRVVLDAAFAQDHLDWIALSDHLRVSNGDAAGNTLPSGIPLSRGLALYQVPAIAALQAAGTYADKTIFSSAEWDMPTHDHFTVGILAGAAPALGALAEFEYRFTDRDPALFDAADVATWGKERHFTTHADALAAIAWLAAHYPDASYGLVTHPSRKPGKNSVSDLRELNDLAPGLVFLVEGMVGNQMEPDRGGYNAEYTEANAPFRTYGGCDAVVARLGGVWDALLGEGRRMWSVGDSDFHFEIAQGMFSSGYFPGAYAKNHVWVDGEGMPAILRGLRAGKAFTVSGDLISDLDFVAAAPGAPAADMGGALHVAAGQTVTLTFRWKSALPGHYEHPIGSGLFPGTLPVVDHVDLIAGDVGARAQPGTPAYAEATNPSTHVLARFDARTATTDAEGFHVVSYTLVATRPQYFRLRGTNLGTDVPGETAGGEPLADAKIDLADHQARFDAINDRNYADLWFYSNPIFVEVR